MALAAPRARADDSQLLAPVAAPLAAPAPAGCDPARAARLDAVLRIEAAAAARWRWTWAAIFGAAVVGQLALVAADAVPAGDRHDPQVMTLYLGAAKAAIGVGARLVLPPRITRPRLTGDACADDRAALAAMAGTALRERQSMALNVFGGLALNLGTSLYVGVVDDAWTDAGIAFAMGTAVATLSALTQPRRVWRRGGVDADGPLVVGWQVTPWTAGRGHGLALTGWF